MKTACDTKLDPNRPAHGECDKDINTKNKSSAGYENKDTPKLTPLGKDPTMEMPFKPPRHGVGEAQMNINAAAGKNEVSEKDGAAKAAYLAGMQAKCAEYGINIEDLVRATQ